MIPPDVQVVSYRHLQSPPLPCCGQQQHWQLWTQNFTINRLVDETNKNAKKWQIKMYHTYILFINLWLCLDNWMSEAVLSCISFMLSVMSPAIELCSLLANALRWYRSLYKIMYNLEISPLHARVLHLGRPKAFVAWAVLNIWLPDWHHPHLHPAWVFFHFQAPHWLY